MIVDGGNPVIGTAGSLGGLGHFALTARVNAIKAALPTPSRQPVAGAVELQRGGPAPMVEGALGLFKGVGGGLLAVDVLGSALILPTASTISPWIQVPPTSATPRWGSVTASVSACSMAAFRSPRSP